MNKKRIQSAKTAGFPIRILLSLAFVGQELLKEFDNISFTDILSCQEKKGYDNYQSVSESSRIPIGITFRKMAGFTDPPQKNCECLGLADSTEISFLFTHSHKKMV